MTEAVSFDGVAALLLALVVVVFVILRGASLSARDWLVTLLIGAGVVSLCGLRVVAAAADRRSAAEVREAIPGERPDPEYVSSNACQACHPGAYDSWHHSYHRTMTQPATPANVLGDFDDVTVDLAGAGERRYHFFRRGDEFWVRMADYRIAAGTGDAAEEVERRIVMTTGSHHMQVYWIEGERPGELMVLPLLYYFEQERWIPRGSAFLTPRSEGITLPWNELCVRCHSTAGYPGVTSSLPERFDTKVAELGIACEACHGPAQEHIRTHRNPLHRYTSRLDEEGDPTIVNPARLPPERSSEVCGQCHGVVRWEDPEALASWRLDGDEFRAGDSLREKGHLVRPNLADEDEWIRSYVASNPEKLPSWFWSDGMIRVSGREYSGMVESACNLGGELSCLSCHSMHDYTERKDQLSAPGVSDQACLQCHQDYAEDIPAHTHHGADSPGSSCYNCHMPHTTYGLLSAMRSHWIDSPSARSSIETGRPNACNLCHLDRTLQWTADRLGEWYGHETELELDAEQQTVAAAPLWLLRGDAGQRALLAWHFGWESAQQASGTEWMAPLLAPLLVDPYDAVRAIAGRSVGTLPGFDGFDYDFVAGTDRLGAAREDALSRWLAGRNARLQGRGAEVLSQPGTTDLDEAMLRALLAQRDDTPIDLLE